MLPVVVACGFSRPCTGRLVRAGPSAGANPPSSPHAVPRAAGGRPRQSGTERGFDRQANGNRELQMANGSERAEILRSRDFIGWAVTSSNGANMGTVSDILI